MKILHINNYDKLGGAEIIFSITSSNPLTENLRGFCVQKSNENQPDVKFSSWEVNKGLTGIVNYIFSIRNYKILSKFLKQSDIEIIHLQGFFSSISPSILLAIKKVKRRKKIKIIQTLHEFHLICPNASLFNFTKNVICEKCVGKKLKFHIFTENCDRRGFLYSIIKGIRSFVANNILSHRDIVDLFISPSHFLREKLVADGISSTRIKVFINPVSFRYSDVIPMKENIICFFGRFSYEKNILFLIHAFSKWKKEFPSNFKLLLIGNGDEKGKIIEGINNSGFKNDIEISPFLEQQLLIEKISKCKFFTLTTLCYENSPLSLIEAVALGIIPMAPDIGGMKESINSLLKAGRTFKSNDIDSWIECINYLENNYSMEIRKVEETRKILPENQSIQRYYEKLNYLYNELSIHGEN